MNANNDEHKCPICGSQMELATTVRHRLGQAQRFRCTCGHVEDVTGLPAMSRPEKVAALPEGIEELPSDAD
jgi:hypothetical protein